MGDSVTVVGRKPRSGPEPDGANLFEKRAAGVTSIAVREVLRQLDHGQGVRESCEFLSRLRAVRSSQIRADDYQLRLDGLHEDHGVREVTRGEHSIAVLAEQFAYVRLHIMGADNAEDVGAELGPASV